jgi:hypothetical protein
MSPRAPGGAADLSLADLIQIDAACDRFEAARRAAAAPPLEAILASVPDPARVRLLREVLIREVEARLNWGERPDAAGYHARFPEHPHVVAAVFALLQGDASPPAATPTR